ncbi:MAG: dihydroorotate dehydrogenase electron transfer subunit [Candidatus Helarchaeota archaeon]
MHKTPLNRPQMVRISRIEQETPTIKTFYLDDAHISNHANPGQFVMVWIPGLDEIPLSISENNPDLALTIKKVGEATAAIHNLEQGDRLGIRGPYGHAFSLKGAHPLIVGGGIGLAPLLFLLRELQAHAQSITVINGARTKNELLFFKKLPTIPFHKVKCIFTTDDGSFGQKGSASAIAIQHLSEDAYDQVYACGPEPMIYELFCTTEELKIPMQASLERLMKCGIGLCGQCCIDPIGYRVCVEGPVFTSDILRKMTDFGTCRRDPSGGKISI